MPRCLHDVQPRTGADALRALLTATVRRTETMTRRLLLFGMLAAWTASSAAAADSLPTALVGEWATAQSEFSRGVLSSGAALYLTTQGVGALIGAPPPIGAQGPATYDAKTQRLTLSLIENGQVMATCGFIYDPSAKVLRSDGAACGSNVFNRRQDSVPEYIRKILK
jgi:hypothetical protein